MIKNNYVILGTEVTIGIGDDNSVILTDGEYQWYPIAQIHPQVNTLSIYSDKYQDFFEYCYKKNKKGHNWLFKIFFSIFAFLTFIVEFIFTLFSGFIFFGLFGLFLMILFFTLQAVVFFYAVLIITPIFLICIALKKAKEDMMSKTKKDVANSIWNLYNGA